jgi:hypothetical protein
MKKLPSLGLVALLGINSSAFAQDVPKEVTQRRASQPTMLSLPPTAWNAFAISRDGRIWELDNQNQELTARGQTRRYCEQATGSHCRAIAVPDNYSVAGILCDDRNGTVGGYLAGSQYGNEVTIAVQKSGDDGFSASDCKLVFP